MARIIAFAATVLLALAARADDTWTRTFDPAALATYLDQKTSLIVVPAGAPTPGLAAAADAVEKGFRASGMTELVMNAKSLGNTTDLDDNAIVGKAAPLPVNLVAIVRLFEETTPANAVLTVYDKKATVAFALSAKAGEKIAPYAGGGLGLSSKAMRSVAESTLHANGGKDRKAALEQYDEKKIYFEDYATVGMNQYGAVVSTSTWSQAFQGKYRKPLNGADFYEAVGHPEMAQHYREVESRNGTAFLIGGALAAASFAAGTVIWIKAVNTTGEPNMGAFAGGLGLSLLGPIVLGGGVCLAMHQNPDSVDAVGARKLVDEYDTKLKHDLKLDDEDAQAEKTSLHVAGGPLPGGAMVGLGGTF